AQRDRVRAIPSAEQVARDLAPAMQNAQHGNSVVFMIVDDEVRQHEPNASLWPQRRAGCPTSGSVFKAAVHRLEFVGIALCNAITGAVVEIGENISDIALCPVRNDDAGHQRFKVARCASISATASSIDTAPPFATSSLASST